MRGADRALFEGEAQEGVHAVFAGFGLCDPVEDGGGQILDGSDHGLRSDLRQGGQAEHGVRDQFGTCYLVVKEHWSLFRTKKPARFARQTGSIYPNPRIVKGYF